MQQVTPKYREKFEKHIANKCTDFGLNKELGATLSARPIGVQVEYINDIYLNDVKINQLYNEPEGVLLKRQVNTLLSTLIPEEISRNLRNATGAKATNSHIGANFRNREKSHYVNSANNVQTVANTLDHYCHKAAPADYHFAKNAVAGLRPKAACFTPQNTKQRQPRAFGRDVFAHRDHITGNPQSTWVKTLRRMNELTAEGTAETTTM